MVKIHSFMESKSSTKLAALIGIAQHTVATFIPKLSVSVAYTKAKNVGSFVFSRLDGFHLKLRVGKDVSYPCTYSSFSQPVTIVDENALSAALFLSSYMRLMVKMGISVAQADVYCLTLFDYFFSNVDVSYVDGDIFIAGVPLPENLDMASITKPSVLAYIKNIMKLV